jgi:hypothetical protein
MLQDQQKFTQLTRTVKVRVVRQKNTVTGPTGPITKNNCAGEVQQQFTHPTDRQECAGEGHHQFIQLTRTVRVSLSHNIVRVVRQNNMIVGPVGPGIKNNCAGKGRQ